MAELKRFIHTSSAAWKGVENKAAYNNSIVFIHDGDKGVSIYTQGATFDTELTAAEVTPIVKDYLKAGSNVTIKEVNGQLEISAPGTATITATSTELVQAGAVAGALRAPMSLSLAVADNKGTFSQNFKNLEGKDVTAASAVIAGGDNITLTQTTDGLKIDAKDTTYTAGTGLTLAEGNVFNHTNKLDAANTETKSDVTLGGDVKTFDFDQYSYDTEGHITGKVTNVVTLPKTAFTDTTYTFTGEGATTVKTEGTSITISSEDNNTTYTIESFQDGDKAQPAIKLTPSEGDAQYVFFKGGENVSIARNNNGAIEFSAVDTTYTGEEAIQVNSNVIQLVIDETDKVLSQSEDGLKANVELAYGDKDGKKHIILKGKDGEELSAIDATDFIKDGMIDSVEMKDNVLTITWNTDAGKEATTIDFSGYIDTFTHYGARNGVKVVTDTDNSYYEAQVKEGEKYLKVDANGLYTDGIDTAISTAINNLDSEKSDSAEASAKANIVNVVTGVTVKQTNGSLESVTVAETEVATAAYVDAAIAALDVTGATVGSVATGADTVNVIDSLTWSETDGKVNITGTTASAATKAYVDSKASAATTKVVKSDDAESVKYLDVTSAKETDGSTTYTVKVSGVDTAISNAVNALDATITATNASNQKLTTAHEGLMFDKIEQKDGKITDGTGSATVVKYVDQSKLTNSSLTGVKYIGIAKTDTISQAFEKCESAWDWGTI